jgi:hypothetical protein
MDGAIALREKDIAAPDMAGKSPPGLSHLLFLSCPTPGPPSVVISRETFIRKEAVKRMGFQQLHSRVYQYHI